MVILGKGFCLAIQRGRRNSKLSMNEQMNITSDENLFYYFESLLMNNIPIGDPSLMK